MPYNTSHTTNTHKPQNQTQKRCSHPLCNTQHTTTPRTPHNHHHTHTRGCVRRSRAGSGTRKNNPPTGKVSSQDPTVRRDSSTTSGIHVPPSHTHHNMHRKVWNLQEGNPRRHAAGLPPHTGKLLRKEVIQPHLPVRLPCYDFVPIAGPTFDHSPPTSGLGHGLRVLPTFVT